MLTEVAGQKSRTSGLSAVLAGPDVYIYMCVCVYCFINGLYPSVLSVVYFITAKAVSHLLHKVYSLKMDVEADYIGLLLVASAGYDPGVGVRAREKMGSNYGGSSWEKMRARLLVLKMEEALAIYREFSEGFYSKREIDEVRTEWCGVVQDFID